MTEYPTPIIADLAGTMTIRIMRLAEDVHHHGKMLLRCDTGFDLDGEGRRILRGEVEDIPDELPARRRLRIAREVQSIVRGLLHYRDIGKIPVVNRVVVAADGTKSSEEVEVYAEP